MATLVRFLMLVACLPLLQPTGVCVCKAGGWGGTTAPHRNDTGTRNVSPKQSACCSHRHCTGDTDLAIKPHPDKPNPCPAPDKDSHLPGCPASPGVDRFRWVEPVFSIAHLPPPAEATVILPLEVVSIFTPVAATSVGRPAECPLYLSHCSFVI